MGDVVESCKWEGGRGLPRRMADSSREALGCAFHACMPACLGTSSSRHLFGLGWKRPNPPHVERPINMNSMHVNSTSSITLELVARARPSLQSVVYSRQMLALKLRAMRTMHLYSLRAWITANWWSHKVVFWLGPSPGSKTFAWLIKDGDPWTGDASLR